MGKTPAVEVPMSASNPGPNESSLPFVEAIYEQFLEDPSSVSESWRDYFQSFETNGHHEHAHIPGLTEGDGFAPGPSFRPSSIFRAASVGTEGDANYNQSLQDRVDKLVRAFRVRGHMAAQVDPLGFQRPKPEELSLVYHGLTERDLDRHVSESTLSGTDINTLRGVYDRLKDTYTRTIGVQFMHIDETKVRDWLQQRMESYGNRTDLSREEQIRILTKLTDATILEEFIHKKFVGAKSFSLGGCETLIPLLDMAIDRGAHLGVEDVVIGMAHRGRLNVLANIIGKSPQQIFREFDDADAEEHRGGGDVKYHLGYNSDFTASNGNNVRLTLCFNPSHLEYVNPVALGRTRSRQDRRNDRDRYRSLCLLIHGDAAFAGEGVVQETLQLSELRGYRTGGTVHIIVNNQIGFTTSPREARSSIYASGIGRMLQIPIFHVNGEDPESCAQVIHMALEFRHAFKRDVVIDMYGYRRLGHNEGDEPAFTQPVLYRAIRKRQSVRHGYLQHMLTLGKVSQEEADAIAAERQEHLDRALETARQDDFKPQLQGATRTWAEYYGGPEADAPDVDTSVPKEELATQLAATARVPDDFHPHRVIKRMLQERLDMAAGKKPLNWGAAEALAFSTLSCQGIPVRLTGQDAERGTFSHRHAILHDYEDGHLYFPLRHVREGQAHIEIHNSPLSESGVLGFEYGYSLDRPNMLVLWEAQFGDFCNAAQVIIDQFISSAEDKWKRYTGLVMLLPHGFEGQGPEHSSARLERFLQLAAEDNMQIVYPTTPAQIFHMLRRQVTRGWRKPLIVMSPKSLLRHPKVVSSLDELATGGFQRFIPDPNPDYESAKRVLLCTGKIFYDLDAAREAQRREDIHIIRVEQLYPMTKETFQAALKNYPETTEVAWVQEEPRNMGALPHIRLHLGQNLVTGHYLREICREESASPATGSAGSHKLEQQELIEQAFDVS